MKIHMRTHTQPQHDANEDEDAVSHYKIDKFHFNPFEGVKLFPHNLLSQTVIAERPRWVPFGKLFSALLRTGGGSGRLSWESKISKISIKQSDFEWSGVLENSKNMFGRNRVQLVQCSLFIEHFLHAIKHACQCEYAGGRKRVEFA